LFYQDRLGTNIGKALPKKGCFIAGHLLPSQLGCPHWLAELTRRMILIDPWDSAAVLTEHAGKYMLGLVTEAAAETF
jgi:hypothetical protein